MPIKSVNLRDNRSDFRVPEYMAVISDYVVEAARNLHHTETVFKSLMCGSRIDVVGQRQLMNVPQSLELRAVDNFYFIRVEPDKPVNGITEF